jgi:hypothetical protein
MRDRTPRCAARMAMAARQRLAFDPLDDVDDLEQQAAGGDVGLGQFQPQSVAETEGVAGPLAYQPLASRAANRPKRVTLVTRPGKVAPTWAAMKAAT